MERIIIFTVCISLVFSMILVPPSYAALQDETYYNYEEPIIGIQELQPLFEINSSKVKLEVQYPANYKPPMTFYYTKTVNGVKYSGTLALDSIRYRETVTYAFYVGYIEPVG